MPRSALLAFLLTPVVALTVAFRAPQDPPSAGSEPQAAAEASVESLLKELEGQGVRSDLQRGLLEVDVRLCQRYEPLEYLLISQPRGKDHEALLYFRGVDVLALNTALLLLGLEPGENARRVPRDPPLTEEEYKAGVPSFTVQPARGDGLYLYVAWEVVDADGNSESYFYRAEDLVLNGRAERTYARGKWVYLGSRFIKPHRDAKEMFAADAEGNLISICYFNPANHLLTGVDPEADDQYVWYPNFYLLPEIDHPMRLIFSREPLETAPPSIGKPLE